jgi:hypothetical protein
MNDKHYMNAEDIEIYKKAYEIAEMLKGATCSIAEETLEMALEIVKTGSVVTLNTERFVRNKKSVDTADSCESEHWEDYINPFPLD